MYSNQSPQQSPYQNASNKHLLTRNKKIWNSSWQKFDDEMTLSLTKWIYKGVIVFTEVIPFCAYSLNKWYVACKFWIINFANYSIFNFLDIGHLMKNYTWDKPHWLFKVVFFFFFFIEQNRICNTLSRVRQNLKYVHIWWKLVICVSKTMNFVLYFIFENLTCIGYGV